MLLPIMASAETVEIDGIWYNLLSWANEAEVTYNPNIGRYLGSYSGSIEIPASVTYNEVEYSVTNIGDDAFRKSTGLVSITIPNSVKSIGQSAFSDCTGLTSVIIPNSVTSTSLCAFAYCTGLISVTIPNSVTNIEWGTFTGCTALSSHYHSQ